ncbi:extracellular solute-binding protein [Sinorhizobium sp. RAC02]|uniref:extracellular solute-binding protein n=1 Tax=Sinorhizobium sp. RAC02 TaxID=1842534 RepID=UPI00083D5FBC|nr:extracellular solute-binding protein [Sinorhizobium sp. RAC02]AOF92506.1 bacterial extracellular solute-binding family protein [Sinorhizobium sp. RAC02]
MKRWLALATACLFATSVEAEEKVLYLYSWESYFSAQSIAEFEKETGIKVSYDLFDSNDMVETKMLTGKSGYDLVTVNLSPHLLRQLPVGVWAPLDRTRLSNLGNLDPTVLTRGESVDAGNAHNVPWMWGTTGVGYNVEKVTAIMPDAPVDSLRMVFDPQIVEKFASCGVGMLDDAEQVLGLALIYLGLNPDTTDKAELEKAVEVVTKVRPYVRKFHSSSYVNDLADGSLCLAIGFSGDMLIASSRAKEAGKPFTVTYRLSKEGNLVWTDVLAIPADASHPQAAHAFIDFFMRPEIAAAAATETGFSTANKAALALLDEKLRENPNLYPSDEAQKRLHLPKALSQKALKMWSQAWDRAKGLR